MCEKVTLSSEQNAHWSLICEESVNKNSSVQQLTAMATHNQRDRCSGRDVDLSVCHVLVSARLSTNDIRRCLTHSQVKLPSAIFWGVKVRSGVDPVLVPSTACQSIKWSQPYVSACIPAANHGAHRNVDGRRCTSPADQGGLALGQRRRAVDHWLRSRAGNETESEDNQSGRKVR